MARKSSPTILQEELYPPSAGTSRGEAYDEPLRADLPNSRIDDARLVDLDVDEESPFLRGQKRVSARRSSLPKKTANRLLWGAIAVAILGAFTLLAAGLYDYGERSWRFRIESSDNIEITGTENVSKAQIMEVMGADIGRNIFFVPLAQQQAQLEQIPWVESSSVMRFVPNRLKVEIHERTPVAFARVGPRISLIDAGGTLMDLPRNHKYSFPVILGMNPGEPLSTRAPRMKAYNELVSELDSGGAHYSQDLSEVDVSDLDDLKIRVNDPAGDVLVELGSSDYLKRYKTFVSHVQEWRQQFQKLESVNLRYDNQVIVNPELEGRTREAALTPASARAAAAAGVKPAALITPVGARNRAVPKPVFELAPQKLDPKLAAKKSATKKSAARKPPAAAKAKKTTASGSTAKAIRGKSQFLSAKSAAAMKPAMHVNTWRKAVLAAPTPASNAASAKPSAAIAKQASSGSSNGSQ
jgi:cell division protein FtsQ